MLLRLNGLEVSCIIGERAEERTREQTLQIDVELEIPETAAETDSLADTVDYAALAEKIRVALVAARCQMIERAAKVVAEVCRAERHVERVRVSVTKAGAIRNLKSATAIYEN